MIGLAKHTHTFLILSFTICIMTQCTDRPSLPLSYGAFVQGNKTTFKLKAPKADRVFLVLFENPEDKTGSEFLMKKTGDDWTITTKKAGHGTLYGYRLEGNYLGNDPDVIVADPYSLASVTQNTYRHVAKSLIIDTSFDWENDSWIKINPRDLIIYEMHIRDMTAHHTSGSKYPGTYHGLVDPDQKGGIDHVKKMGVNAVQLLPAQEFANVEVPYKNKSASVFNNWNPYARNHWGYMTTFFFAPETYYGSDGTDEPGKWNGTDGRAVREFKDMVKAFHREGIAVIMDVVYNHVSNYDYHPLKFIDREMYFRLENNGSYISKSGCGNDTRSENPAMSQMILESVRYWMTEYHIDGFRFDIGNLIDSETRQKIIDELKKINPNVIILAEPWGDGYDPSGFSEMGWASFNDQFRDGLKGSVFNVHDRGFLFGKRREEDNHDFLKRIILGSRKDFGGQYKDAAHSVNYLECHDNHTLGDRLRITGGFIGENEVITDKLAHSQVNGKLLDMNKLGALFLFTSQGIVFMHEGQEWARSKIIAETEAPDNRIGQIDHNSYEKDNETNWINWDEKELNKGLVSYYKGLIQIRKNYPDFRHSEPEDYKFMDLEGEIAVAYSLGDNIFVVINGDYEKSLKLNLPVGEWHVLANSESIDSEGHQTLSKIVSLPPTSGMILVRSESLKKQVDLN